MSTESNRDPLTDRLLKAALRSRERAVSDACLDAETLAAWADGSVSGQAASAIEAHLADCARCQSMLAAFATSESAESADLAAAGVTETTARGAVIPFRSRSPMRWLVPVAAGAAAASLLIWTAWPRPGAPIAPAEQAMARTESVPVPTPLPPANRAQQPDSPVEGSAKSIASPKPDQPAAADARTLRKAEPAGTGRAAETLQKSAPAISPTFAPPPPAPAATAAGAAASAKPLPPPPSGIAPPRATSRAVSDVVTVTAAAELVRTDIPATSVVMEFKPPETSTPTVGQAMAAGGAGRGGGGGRTVAAPPIPASLIRWRVLASGQAMKSTDGGVTWHPVAIETGVQITNGAAPSTSVCWLVGRRGVVLLSTDAMKFARVSSPDAADLTSIIAIDANQATVTTVDGRVFRTTDGGKTWQ